MNGYSEIYPSRRKGRWPFVLNAPHASPDVVPGYSIDITKRKRLSADGYDPGSKKLALRLAKRFSADLVLGGICRLELELNRVKTDCYPQIAEIESPSCDDQDDHPALCEYSSVPTPCTGTHAQLRSGRGEFQFRTGSSFVISPQAVS